MILTILEDLVKEYSYKEYEEINDVSMVVFEKSNLFDLLEAVQEINTEDGLVRYFVEKYIDKMLSHDAVDGLKGFTKKDYIEMINWVDGIGETTSTQKLWILYGIMRQVKPTKKLPI